MASINDHRQELTIYRMVLDRLPFIVDDCQDRFKEEITGVDTTAKTLTIAGDFTSYLRENQIVVVDETAASLVVSGANYDGSVATTINLFSLLASQASVGNTLCIDANYNEQLISRYIYQMMVQLQPCFEITPAENVGVESEYSILQKMIIADLVSWYILFRQSLINGQGDANNGDPTPTPPPQRYVKTAKAGEVSTTWDYLKLSDTGYASLDTGKMMAAFKENAVCLAAQLGCNVEVCADGAISCSCSGNSTPVVENGILVAGNLPPCPSTKTNFFL